MYYIFTVISTVVLLAAIVGVTSLPLHVANMSGVLLPVVHVLFLYAMYFLLRRHLEPLKSVLFTLYHSTGYTEC